MTDWTPIANYEKNGRVVELLCPPCETNPLSDGGPFVTIGLNDFENDGEDQWKLVGWCWSHDHFTDHSDAVPTHFRELGAIPDNYPRSDGDSRG